MKERRLRLLPLFMFVLYALCIYQAQAQESAQSSQSLEGSPKPSTAAQPSSQIILQEPASGSSEISEGAILVKQALSILRHLDPSSRYAPRKPLGLLSTTRYYGIELFKLLFMNGPPADSPTGSEHKSHGAESALQEGVRLLEQAAHLNNSDAVYLLADMNFYGNFTHPKNYTVAFERYHELASLDGNSTAQYMVGFMYATGLGDVVERDQAKALLYHTFAARAGNTKSEMTLAFRHFSGIGTARSCVDASRYYKKVAEKAIEFSRSGPPGGRAWPAESYSLAIDDGGIYGEGASVTSSGRNAQKAGPNSDAHAALDDVLEYLDLMSRKGDFKATFSLGRLHYDGQRDLPVNMRDARNYFMRVAKLYWTRDGLVKETDKPGLEKVASKAAGYLGRMFLRGEGVQQSFDKALTWFKRGITSGDSGSQYGMGLMYLDGLGVPKNPTKAAEYFKAAAEQDYAPAQVALGRLFLDQGDLSSAGRYFEFAAATHHMHIEAYYHLAELYDQGVGRERSCGSATQLYKAVAERAEPIHSSFTEANQAYAAGDLELALVEYMMAAEQGYESGQANVAYILDQEKSNLPISTIANSVVPFKKTQKTILQNAALALIYWTRSAKQMNIDSMVKMGDYYLKGIGAEADMEKAAACYTAASEFQQSAQALYNLGWMHENGIGLTQDFHLAKRYYDQALETNEEAYLPVTLSLFKLLLRSFWNTISYGGVNSIRDEPVEQKQWSLSEWVSNFLRDDHPYYHDGDYEEDNIASFNDREMPGGDGNGIYDDGIDEGILESLLILGLAATLVFLIYYRQQRQLAHRRGEDAVRAQQGGAVPVEGGQEQAGDRGMFPQPGDPAFRDWVAGGIGH